MAKKAEIENLQKAHSDETKKYLKNEMDRQLNYLKHFVGRNCKTGTKDVQTVKTLEENFKAYPYRYDTIVKLYNEQLRCDENVGVPIVSPSGGVPIASPKGRHSGMGDASPSTWHKSVHLVSPSVKHKDTRPS